MHAAWSFGLLGGSAVTAVSAAARVGLQAELPAVAAAMVLITLLASPRLLSGTASGVETARFVLPRGPLALPAVLMFCAFFIESSAMNWSAVFLSGPVGAGSAVAAGAVVAYAAAMGAARLFGDRLLLRWGFGGFARRSGMRHMRRDAARHPDALARSGLHRVRARRSRLCGDRPGPVPVRRVDAGDLAERRVAAIATAGYSGGLLDGLVIGFVARGVGLSAALGLLVVAGAVIVRFGPRLGSRRMKVGVVGLGAMGSGIAQLCVEAGLDTVGREVTADLGEQARTASGIPDAQGGEGPARAVDPRCSR